jgi:hypothetical protein
MSWSVAIANTGNTNLIASLPSPALPIIADITLLPQNSAK